MTASSGQPYTGHGTPRLPIQPNQPPNPSLRSAHAYTANAISSYANGHTLPTVHFTTASQPGPQVENGNNGFSSVQLQPPTNGGPSSSSPQNMASGVQPLPIQPIRPIQPGVIQFHLKVFDHWPEFLWCTMRNVTHIVWKSIKSLISQQKKTVSVVERNHYQKCFSWNEIFIFTYFLKLANFVRENSNIETFTAIF